MSADGKLLISAGEDREICLWNLETGKLVQTFDGHEFAVTSLSFSENDKRIISGSLDLNVIVWDIAGAIQSSGDTAPMARCHAVEITAIRADSKSDRIISASKDGRIKVWRSPCVTGPEGLTLDFDLFEHSKEVWALGLDRSGRRLISGGFDAKLIEWDLVDPE